MFVCLFCVCVFVFLGFFACGLVRWSMLFEVSLSLLLLAPVSLGPSRSLSLSVSLSRLEEDCSSPRHRLEQIQQDVFQITRFIGRKDKPLRRTQASWNGVTHTHTLGEGKRERVAVHRPHKKSRRKDVQHAAIANCVPAVVVLTRNICRHCPKETTGYTQ